MQHYHFAQQWQGVFRKCWLLHATCNSDKKATPIGGWCPKYCKILAYMTDLQPTLQAVRIPEPETEFSAKSSIPRTSSSPQPNMFGLVTGCNDRLLPEAAANRYTTIPFHRNNPNLALATDRAHQAPAWARAMSFAAIQRNDVTAPVVPLDPRLPTRQTPHPNSLR